MSRLKQERALKLMQDYYVVGSSNDIPSPLWHRRHRRWVQPDNRLVAAFSLFKFDWHIDLMLAVWDGEEDVAVEVETYKTNEPMTHDDAVGEFIKAHLEMASDRDNIAAVGWVLRIDPGAPSSRTLAELIGLE